MKPSPKLFNTLEFLVINHHRVVTKTELLQNVWQVENTARNSVEQVVTKLRRLLADEKENPRFIETVPGGYRFIAPLIFPDPENPPDTEIRQTSIGSAPDQPDTFPISATSTLSQITTSTARDWKIRWRSPKYWIIASLPAVFGLAIFLYTTAPGQPSACEVSVNTLIVKDGRGREVWRREFPERLDRDWYSLPRPICQYTDLNRDRVADVLFSMKTATSQTDNDILWGFITPPRLLRALRISPQRVLTFHPGADFVVGRNSDGTLDKLSDAYLGPYTIVGVFPETNDGSKTRIAVSSVTNYAPNQIAVLDGGLNKISEYWHTGHLKYGQFAKYNGQDRLFLAGVNNGYHSATLVAFDPSKINGTTDLSMKLLDWMPTFAVYAGGSRGHITPFGAGTETCRVLFERTCVAKATPHREPYNRVISVTVNDERISVNVAEGEREDKPETILYELDRHLNLVTAFPNTKFQQRHLELEGLGLLDHHFSPEELKPLIHVLPGCEFVEKEK